MENRCPNRTYLHRPASTPRVRENPEHSVKPSCSGFRDAAGWKREQEASKPNLRPASSARITAGPRHPPEPEAVAECTLARSLPRVLRPAAQNPTMIARTDTKTTPTATHHCLSPRRPLPGGITPRTLAAVGKRRVNAVTLTSHFFLNRSRQIRECQASSQLVVAARADKRTPGSPGQGRRTRGSTQRVGDCHSVRERTRPRSTRNMASPFIGPLAMAASILRHPRFRPAPQRRTGAGVRATCRRWGGGENLPVAPRLPSASL